MLTKREEYIKTFFIPLQKKAGIEYMSDFEAEKIVKRISNIGKNLGFIGQNLNQNSEKTEKRKHKYDVWIAKEAKKDLNILDMSLDLRLIIDWAVETKADLFAYDFNEANEEQSKWHQQMLKQYEIENLEIPDIDLNRVVFRFSDKKHFLYLLSPTDLKYEGQSMGHCVGGQNYKTKVKNKVVLILSLRDQKNEPHITIEIDVSNSQVIQQQGKGNREPVLKYKKMLKEFVLFASNFKGLENPEVLKFLNMHFFDIKSSD